MIREEGWFSGKLIEIRNRARALPIPPFVKLGALVAAGIAPFAFFVFLQSSDNPNDPEQEPTQPVGDERIPLAFPFGTPEPSPLPTPSESPGESTTTSKPASPAPVQCNDGLDNDKDGKIDLADSGCSSRADKIEGAAPAITTTRVTVPPTVTTTAAPTTTVPPTTAAPPTTTPPTTSPPQPTDPPATTTRRGVQGECSDGIDNDDDGKTDLDDVASCHGDPTDDE